MNNEVVNAPAESRLRERLKAMAVSLALPGRLPWTDDAISLACDLLAANIDTPATVEVAALSYGTTWSDSEQLVRTMLAEHGLPVPGANASDAERFDFVLRAFASYGLTLHAFLTALYRGLPEWHEQTEIQQALVLLANDLDFETTPAGKARVVSAMREAARLETERKS
jgi:hypothetical protein